MPENVVLFFKIYCNVIVGEVTTTTTITHLALYFLKEIYLFVRLQSASSGNPARVLYIVKEVS